MPVNIRTLWQSEALHFTPWLAQHLDELDVLGIGPLNLVAAERSIPGTGRALDLLAETADGHLVAVENQYATADHDHLTRALAYAVALEARAVVIVAESHRDEFRAVARYLNDTAEHAGDRGIHVFLVEVSVAEVEGYFVVRFEVVERPNTWVEAVADGRPPMLSSVEEFLDRCPTASRDRLRRIIDDWLNDPAIDGARASHNAIATVALYRSNSVKGSGAQIAVYLLDTTGTLTINRGYLLEGGLGRDDNAVQRLDQALAEHFPDLRRTEKNYYPKVLEPDPSAVRRFSNWLATEFAAAAAT